MVSLIVFGLAVALLIAHMLDRRVPRSYVVAAFVASAVIAAGDLREPAGQVCRVENDVEICMYEYSVKVEALAALIASVGFAALTLVFELLERLSRAVASGWDV